MTLAQWGSLILLNYIGMITPGPDFLLLTRIALKSRKHAIAGVFGIATGLLLWVSLTVFGASVVLTAYPKLVGIIQLVGGCWLVWMGRGMLLAARDQFRTKVVVDDITAVLGTPWHSYRQGALTNLSNPKVVLYFAAIIAPNMPPNPSLLLALAIIVVVIGSVIIGFSAIVFGLSTAVVRAKFLRAGPFIDAGAGLFFIVAGTSLALVGGYSLL
ncbi:LysE family translocator [Corynebacterium sp. HS2168-gen11]|uniref:LysE family translocator n=1 Tax=Corynebacterium sp. HS2168-gen11 TaxID=2974027 RepID=UPI00216ADE47|nr:LysE family translocator [Corynebacterium sp. HS2168-gen11]MCS4535350.1 LysE family translocator [Corynebacterium sp. HS2168-gen11]